MLLCKSRSHCNTEHLFPNHLKLKPHKIVFAHNLFLSCPIVLQFYTKHSSITIGQLEQVLWRNYILWDLILNELQKDFLYINNTTLWLISENLTSGLACMHTKLPESGGWSLYDDIGRHKYTPGKKFLQKFSKLIFHSVRHWGASWKIVNMMCIYLVTCLAEMSENDRIVFAQ